MTNTIRFTIDDQDVEAHDGESIWQVAKRNKIGIPHLCWSNRPGYRADGNCRVCMVEIEGERVLAASCIRKPDEGMAVRSTSERAKKAREMVFEMLLADQPARETSHDPTSKFWRSIDKIGLTESRLPRRDTPPPDPSHPAMAVNLDACIHCTLCVRACREVQVNDVIGMAHRGHDARIVFDMDDPMGESTCVACGECVQACPTGALMESSLLDAQKNTRTIWADRQVDSICPYCGVGCQITYNIKDDKIVSVDGTTGPSNENRLCVKGRFGFDYITHPHRLTRPLIRKDGVGKAADMDLDAGNLSAVFREATWDEALDTAAEGLRRILQRDGDRALAGFGSAKCTNEEAYIFQKLVRTGFRNNNVDHCTRLCHASSVAALMEGIGSGAVTAPFTACRDADVIFVIGANPTENHPVAATFFKQAARDGKTLIVADPRGQTLKRHADFMLEFQPATDVALTNAMLNVIIEEELYDRQYVEANTIGFAQIRENVKEFTPEEMSKICGIDPDTLRAVARTYAQAERAIIFWGMGVSQHIHGTDNSRNLIALALITGHIGRPGTGLHPLRGQNNVQGASDAGLIPMVFPDYQPVEDEGIRARFEEVWQTKIDPEPGLTVVEIMNAVSDGAISGMYIMGENPAMSDPNTGHVREALSSLEHLVVQDLFLTETAFHADVVLPASAWPEKDGTVTNTNRQIQMGRRALELPGETRQDWWIIQELAKRLGLDWNYTGPADIFAEMKVVMNSLDNITWERIDAENSVTYPCPAPDAEGQEIVFGEGFPTADGRATLVPTVPQPPHEDVDDEFPLVLITGRQLEHWHTGAMTRRSSVLDALEPEAVACMSPAEMRKRGIQPGEPVRVTTRRGVIELIVRADNAIQPGMVFIPFCFAEAPANWLTSPQLDPWGKIPEFKFNAARVEKLPA